MKTLKKYFNLILLSVLIVSITSCERNEGLSINKGDNTRQSSKSTTVCGETRTTELYAGQHVLVGAVSVQNTDTELLITISSMNGWVFGQTHVYVGSLANLPRNRRGNPVPGQFPYSTRHSPMLNSFTYRIPLEGLGSCFIVAVHAEMHLIQDGITVQSETAWANGTPIVSQGNWGTYYSYCIQNCCEINPQQFAIFGGQTIPVGTLVVTNDASNLYVTYTTTSCWELAGTHLYVGEASGLPINNSNVPIPGHFPFRDSHAIGTTSFTYTIPLDGLPECYIIAAHSSVQCLQGGEVTQGESAWSQGTPFQNTNRWGWYSQYCTQGCQ